MQDKKGKAEENKADKCKKRQQTVKKACRPAKKGNKSKIDDDSEDDNEPLAALTHGKKERLQQLKLLAAVKVPRKQI